MKVIGKELIEGNARPSTNNLVVFNFLIKKTTNFGSPLRHLYFPFFFLLRNMVKGLLRKNEGLPPNFRLPIQNLKKKWRR